LGSLTLARGSPPRDADVLILAIGDVGSQLAPHGRDTPEVGERWVKRRGDSAAFLPDGVPPYQTNAELGHHI